ncbi:MAG: MOSC domain-containing protein [Nocardioides sp.]|uniref:MOSC domain-containing protein n=1 Tax=Nocardioides sp. TaxID=35761 RepID=UPI003D6A6486
MSDELRVVRAGFAPVKGTRHLSYDAVSLDAQGAVGDRGFALVALDEEDPTRGQVLRTVQSPSLVAVRSELVGERLDVELPGGETASAVPVRSRRTVTCDYWGREVALELLEGPHAGLFSRWLGRPVRLARARRGDVVFAAPVTLVTTASLRDLAQRSERPDLPEQAARFRSTVVVDTDEPYAEEGWTGRIIQVGGARVRIGVPIPRCAVVDLHPETSVRDVRLLRTLSGYRPRNRAGEPVFGMFAEVLTPGEVSVAPSP